jgi:predicted deacylase
MAPKVEDWTIKVGHRADGSPWTIRVFSIEGSTSGPSTAFVAGLYGDKPLACVSLLELAERLSADDGLRGNVTIIPVANPPAFDRGTRVSPDFMYLNRQFPGKPEGFLTDQIAYHVYKTVVERADCIVDLHSGTATMGLWYGYDFGNVALSSSFGYVPVVVNHPVGGTMCSAAHEAGLQTFAVEFGGGAKGSPTVGVEGCLNVLKFRGHLDGEPTGPARVPIIDRVQLYLPSSAGVLGCVYGTDEVGRDVEPGVVAWVANIQTGARVEEMKVEDKGLLMLANATPLMVDPGAFACMVGFPSGEATVRGVAG